MFLNGIGIYTSEVEKIVLKSDDYSEDGSWKIEKDVKWIEKNKVDINLKLSSNMYIDDTKKDIVMIIDTSDTMHGDKINNIKTTTISLLDTLLKNNNKISLISFNATAQIVQEFTNDKELLEQKIKSLTTGIGTNYNQALLKLDNLLKTYKKENDRELIIMFLSDGYPVEENPSQIATYHILKSKYDYINISAIQYEMGNKISDAIKNISDKQYIATTSNIESILLDVLAYSKKYEKFIVTDYISKYFSINKIDDIEVSIGDIKLENENNTQKIIWNLNNEYMSGSTAKMKIIANIKDEYKTKDSYYPVNDKINVKYLIKNTEEKNKSTTDTPVVSNYYKVIYNLNLPKGCNLAKIDAEDYLVYDNVIINNQKLKCNGYLFKGFEILTEGVELINNDMFTMPNKDVVIAGSWSKQGIVKTMDGSISSVKESATLYNVIKEQAEIGTIAKKYTGTHKDSFTKTATHDIYHFYANDSTTAASVLNKNNVLFADHCWQMIRTTDTGGVKLIYNGEPDSSGKCSQDRSEHVGYNYLTKISLNDNYYYGTSYTYNNKTNSFSIAGTKQVSKWNATTAPHLIGKYTCKSIEANGTCNTIYMIEKFDTITSARAIVLSSQTHYSQFGTLSYNYEYNSPAYVGYMYGTPYETYYEGITSEQLIFNEDTQEILYSFSLSEMAPYVSYFWFANSIKYEEDSDLYLLNNPYQVESTTQIDTLIGKYTFANTDKGYNDSYVFYIAGIDNENIYVLQLGGGYTLEFFNDIKYGDTITRNNNGTYTINNPKTGTISDWFNDYESFNNKYTCNSKEDTCEEMYYVISTSKTGYIYKQVGEEQILIAKNRNGLNLTDTLLIDREELANNYNNYSDYKYTCNTLSNTCSEANLRMITSINNSYYNYFKNHYFAETATYSNGKYTLVNTIDVESVNDTSKIATHHYMCVEPGKKECSEIAYIYQAWTNDLRYVILKNGELDAQGTLEKMLRNNTNESTIKKGIDAWYEKHLINYEDYLEDTIFCNDRSITNLESTGWNKNYTGSMSNYLRFKNYDLNTDLSCSLETDQFSTENSKAKLDYPIGLATSTEMNLLNNNDVRATDYWFWLGSPRDFYDDSAFVRGVDGNGSINNGYVNSYDGVRPVVSLASGTGYVSGDGSTNNPYVVE